MRCKKTTVSTKGLLIASLLHHDIPTHFKSHTHMIVSHHNSFVEVPPARILLRTGGNVAFLIFFERSQCTIWAAKVV